MTQQNQGIRIHSFDNFGTLEEHIRSVRGSYADALKKYEDVLGGVLRDTQSGDGVEEKKNQEQWSQQLRTGLSGSSKDIKKSKKEDKHENKKKEGGSLFGGKKAKDKKDKNNQGEFQNSGEWITLDPLSIFVGDKSRGLGELYFDSINLLRDAIGKLDLALSLCETLKARTAMGSNVELVVSFVNDIPVKVVLKPKPQLESKKYALAYDFVIPTIRKS